MRNVAAAISRVKSRPTSRMNVIQSARNAGKESLKAVRNGSELKEEERAFVLKTLFSACVSLVFSAIGYLLLGPLGVIAQVALFQRRFFRDLETLLIMMERS